MSDKVTLNLSWEMKNGDSFNYIIKGNSFEHIFSIIMSNIPEYWNLLVFLEPWSNVSDTRGVPFSEYSDTLHSWLEKNVSESALKERLEQFLPDILEMNADAEELKNLPLSGMNRITNYSPDPNVLIA